MTSEEQNKVKRMKKKNKDSLRDLWDDIKCTNILIIGVPEIPWMEEPGRLWSMGSLREWLHFHFHALEKEMATHSSVLAWRIPGAGGVWWADVYGVAQSRTWLKWLSSRRRREKERVWENFRSDYSWKFPQHGKENSQSSPRGTKSPIQDKPMEKHTKTLTDQTKTKHKERILKAAREKQQVTYKETPYT